MSQVRLSGGKPILVAGKVAIADSCCCPGTNGACCPEDGSDCYITTLELCVASNGTFQGSGTNCNAVNCTNGACCPEDGSDCYLTSLVDCSSANGNFYGNGTNCDGINCALPPSGACCVDGVCSITTEADCIGNYLGDGTTCDGIDCTNGACCESSLCTITTEETCTGIYQGDGSTCPNECCCGFLVDGILYLTKNTHGEFHSHPGFPFNSVDIVYDSTETRIVSEGACASTFSGHCISTVCTTNDPNPSAFTQVRELNQNSDGTWTGTQIVTQGLDCGCSGGGSCTTTTEDVTSCASPGSFTDTYSNPCTPGMSPPP